MLALRFIVQRESKFETGKFLCNISISEFATSNVSVERLNNTVKIDVNKESTVLIFIFLGLQIDTICYEANSTNHFIIITDSATKLEFRHCYKPQKVEHCAMKNHI